MIAWGVRSPVRRLVMAGPLLALVAGLGLVSATPSPAGPHVCDPAWRVTETLDVDPLNSQLSAVDARTSADVWAVGYRSAGALSMHWDGASWTDVPVPVPAGTDSMSAFDVEALAVDDAWAVGGRSDADPGDHAAILHWNGRAWSLAPLADLTGVYGELLGIDAVAADDIWAVGFQRGSTPGGDPRPLVMHFDGDAWHVVTTPSLAGPDASLLDVRALAPDDVWAVGSRQPPLTSEIGDRTLIEHWDGSSWTVVPSPEADDQNHALTTVDGAGPTDVWAGGSIGGYQPLLEHWDGAAWTLANTGLSDDPQGVNDLEVVNDHDVWALMGRLRAPTVQIHYDGTTWAEAPGPPSPKRLLLDVDAAPGGELWTVGAVLGKRHAALAERLCPSRPSSSGFLPGTVLIPHGGALAWTVPAGDPGTYRFTDETGLGLFDSGPLGQTDTFTQAFVAAGTYVVAESSTGTDQTVRVRAAAEARPRRGPGTVKVIWSADALPAGLVADVQMRHRGEPWAWFLRGTDASSGFATEDPAAGRVSFRARLRDPASAAVSGWSPPTHVVPV